MFVVSEAEAAAIRDIFHERGELAAAAELRRFKDAAGTAATGRYAFHAFLQHRALSDRRLDDAIPEPLSQLSQRPPAGAVSRSDQLEVEGLQRVDGL